MVDQQWSSCTIVRNGEETIEVMLPADSDLKAGHVTLIETNLANDALNSDMLPELRAVDPLRD